MKISALYYYFTSFIVKKMYFCNKTFIQSNPKPIQCQMHFIYLYERYTLKQKKNIHKNNLFGKFPNTWNNIFWLVHDWFHWNVKGLIGDIYMWNCEINWAFRNRRLYFFVESACWTDITRPHWRKSLLLTFLLASWIP